MRTNLTHSCFWLTYLPSMLLAHGAMGVDTKAAEQPNILLIAIDDLRPELGCYGAHHVKTPRVDALAARGLLFERAYCQQAVCNPSRTSLMTGLRPDTIGVTGNHVHFRDNRPDVVTLPQHFINHGYHAQSIGKIYHGVFPDGASATVWDTMGDPLSWSVATTRFGPRYYFTEAGIRQAKQSYLAMYGPQNPAADDWTEKLVFGPMTEAPDVPDNRLYDGKVADAAVAVLQEFGRRPDRPFFLAVGFIKPHSPFVAPKKYFDLYNEGDVSLATNDELPVGAPRLAGHESREVRRYTDQPKQGPFDAANQRRLRHAYYACTSFIDAQVGRVLDELRQQNLEDNTIVVLFGDHGWHLGEHGLWGKTTNFELDTRVPLIVTAPGMNQRGRRTHGLTELVDLYPTLSELAGLPVAEQLEGTSFAPLLDDPNAPSDTAAYSQFPRGGNADHGGKTMGYSVRTDRWRYTEWIEHASDQVVANELYDSRNDPLETVNLASDPAQSAVVTRLSRQLDRGAGWKQRDRLSAAPANRHAAVSTTVFELGDGIDSPYGYRIPALAVSKKNTILAFCERRTGLHDHAQNDIVLRRSTDQGKSFGPQIVVQEDNDNVLVNPCVVTLDSNRLLMMYQRFPAGYHSRSGKHMKLLDPGLVGPTVSRTLVIHSDDDGLHWSQPRDVTAQTKRPHVNSTATGPGQGIVLTRGAHRGRILMPTNEGWFAGNRRYFNVYACFSDDKGETWHAGAPAPNGSPGNGNEVQMVELADGSVQLNSRSYGGSRLRKLAISRDGGASWTPLEDHRQLPEPQCMGSVLRYSFPEAGPSRILYAGPGGQQSRSQGTVRISYDEGATWPISREIEPGAFAYSCLARLASGDVGLLYEAKKCRQINFLRLPIASLERRPAIKAARPALPSRRSQSPVRIACIGDSITFGTGLVDRRRQSYPARLQQLLGPNFEVRNFGRSGADVLSVNNGPYAATEQHRLALALEPDIVVCNLGINDIHLLAENQTRFVDDYTRLLQQYASLSSPPKIYLWTDLAPVMPGQPHYQHYLKLKATYAALLRQVAAAVDGQGIDMYTPLKGHPEWFPDHLHPNAAGAKKIADVVANVVAPGGPRLATVALRSIAATDDLAGSFEAAPAGPLSKLSTPLGVWTAEPGHAEIDPHHSHSGQQCLHVLGGDDRQIELTLQGAEEPPAELSFWAERWTRRAPFEFRVQQRVGQEWVEIFNGDKVVHIGGFLTRVRVPLRQSRSYQLRIRCSSPPRSGLLIDDVELISAAALQVAAVTADAPVLPALVGTAASAICRIRVDVAGNSGDPPVVAGITLSTAGTTELSDVERVELYYCGQRALPSATDTANAFATAQNFGDPQSPAESLKFEGRQQLRAGPNYFWVTFRLSSDANIDHRLRATPRSLTLAGQQPQPIRQAKTASGQRMGVAVRRRGDDGVHTYRIPGLATTNQGSLIGVYDIRRRSGGDLPGDIDVGMSRSTDGGQTWQPMQVIMDMGSDPQWEYDGIGDPTVLVDRVTGTIWVAATWSHGNRSWFGSGPGLEPTETGQFMLVRSDDDGVSWSQPINITKQVKRPEWSFLLQGPGKGITMHDGRLVIPAQFQDTPENKRLPRSTFISSADHGETWQIATGAFDDTTEAQVVELDAGQLMINCRYNRESKRVVMTTADLGRTWQVHPSSRQALIEPKACMASLIYADRELGTDVGDWLFFSNPHSLRARERITIQASNDQGLTWPKDLQTLLDVGEGAGYSCLTMIDHDTVGILYEGSQSHLTFQRIKLKDFLPALKNGSR